MGLAPLTGIPLPFVSYGGSSLVVALAAWAFSLTSRHGGGRGAARADRGRGDGRPRAAGARGGGSADARGVQVTFAGSPDRVEARLVPAAGYELDPFASPACRGGRRSRSRARSAGRAPLACRGSSSGGGPTSSSAAAATSRGRWCSQRGSSASRRADGGGRAPRPREPPRRAVRRRVFLAYPIDGPRGPKYRVVGRPIPARSRPRAAGARRGATFGLPGDGPVLLVVGAQPGAQSSTRLRSRRSRDEGPAVLHLSGERDYPALARASRDRTTGCSPSPTTSARRSRPPTSSLARAGGSSGRSRPPASPRSSSRTRTRPPTTRRRTPSWFERAAARSSSGARSSSRAGARALAPRRPGAARAMGEAMSRAAAGRGRRHRRGADRPCSRSPVGGSGSSASAEPE